jgi:hypothetical protein
MQMYLESLTPLIMSYRLSGYANLPNMGLSINRPCGSGIHIGYCNVRSGHSCYLFERPIMKNEAILNELFDAEFKFKIRQLVKHKADESIKLVVTERTLCQDVSGYLRLYTVSAIQQLGNGAIEAATAMLPETVLAR